MGLWKEKKKTNCAHIFRHLTNETNSLVIKKCSIWNAHLIGTLAGEGGKQQLWRMGLADVDVFAQVRKVKCSQVPPSTSICSAWASQSSPETAIPWLLIGRRIFRLHLLPSLKSQSGSEHHLNTTPVPLKKDTGAGNIVGTRFWTGTYSSHDLIW